LLGLAGHIRDDERRRSGRDNQCYGCSGEGGGSSCRILADDGTGSCGGA